MVEEMVVGKRWFVIAVPPLLIASMYGAFRYLTARFGFPTGYLAAFGVYWVGWCVIVPTGILGTRAVLDLFSRWGVPFAKLGATTHVLLWSPLLFPLAFSFVPRIGSTSVVILIASIALGIVIGVTEELLWRGLYVTAFPNRLSLNTTYPSIAFGLWHLCPLSALPSRYPGGALAFAGYSVVLGLSYAYYARRTGSIRWCTVSHCIHDALGLGAFAYASWLT
jgi:membrane protease YdiL (CAAX protease family)